MSRPLVRVRELVHAYDRDPVLAVPELDLTPGRWHLGGPNGAGKSTLLSILATLERPTRGRVNVAGHRLPDEAVKARASLGYAGHEPSLHGALPVRQALALHARLHEVPSRRVGQALEAWGLVGLGQRAVGQLSAGQRRRLDLARSLLHRPEVLLLDEPARGLDEEAIDRLDQQIAEAAPRLVVLASPRTPPLPVDERIALAAGRPVEASP